MGAEAKNYLEEHSIPQLFEISGLETVDFQVICFDYIKNGAESFMNTKALVKKNMQKLWFSLRTKYSFKFVVLFFTYVKETFWSSRQPVLNLVSFGFSFYCKKRFEVLIDPNYRVTQTPTPIEVNSAESFLLLNNALVSKGLITGLVYNKPEDPLGFLEKAIAKIRAHPDQEYSWDMFNENEPDNRRTSTVTLKQKIKTKTKKDGKSTTKGQEGAQSGLTARSASQEVQRKIRRVPSLTKAAEVAKVPDVPIIVFMGGPGGGKTKYAAKVRDALEDEGLVHLCMPDMIRSAIAKYKDRYPAWKEAAERFQRGELIANNLALDLVKAEMGRNPDAKAFFLEGFPREARQVEDFEREVRQVDMVMILDYDEATLRNHMESRGLDPEMIDRKIRNFKMKTLPSAKYFDEQRLLHLIPGEADDMTICSRMKKLVRRAMEYGIPLSRSAVSSRKHSPTKSLASPTALEAEIVARETGIIPSRGSRRRSGPRSSRPSTSASRQSIAPSMGSQMMIPENDEPLSSSRLPNGDMPTSLKGTPRTTEDFKVNPANVVSTSTVISNALKSRDSEPEEDVGQLAPVEKITNQESEPEQEPTSRPDTDLEPDAILKPTSEPVLEPRPSSKPKQPPETEPKSDPQPPSGPIHEAKAKVEGVAASDVSFTSTVVESKPEPVLESAVNTTPDLVKQDSRPETSKSAKSNKSLKSIKSAISIISKKSEESVVTDTGLNKLRDKEEQNEVIENADSTTSNLHVEKGGPEVSATGGPLTTNDLSSCKTTISANFSVVNDDQIGASDEMASVIFVIGPPGANKAEIAKQILMKFEGFDVYSMGSLLRQKVEENRHDPLWQKVEEKMNKGELIPDEICREILFNKMKEDGNSWGYVIEGYPRTEAQAKDFAEQFKRLDLALLIDCTEQFCKNALKKRCETATLKTKRLDDDPDIVEIRLANFKQNTLPMLRLLDTEGKLRVVDGDADIDKIFYEVSSVIESTLFSEDNRTNTEHVTTTTASRNDRTATAESSKKAKFLFDKTPPTTAAVVSPTPESNKSKVTEAAPSNQKRNSNASRLEEIGYHLSSRGGSFPHGLPNDSPCFLVIGPPGGNKTEIARRITVKYKGYKWFSMGGLLRTKIENNAGDALWEKVRQFMNNGKPIIDEICREVLYPNVYATDKNCKGFVFEGYPRTPEQAIDFEKQFERIDMALLIDCTEEYCLKNIAKRYEKAGVNESRKDDAPEIATIRLSMFKQNTLPMVKYFDEKGRLRVVDGDADFDKIFYEVSSIIDTLTTPS